VPAADPVAVPPPPAPVSYSAAQTRIINAALELFAVHGVGGTSLQMIADAIGVTKAAVYHQFRTKDEIVIAAAEADLARLAAVLDAAEAEGDRTQSREVLVTRLIDIAVDHRRMVSILQSDPVMVRLLAEHEPFQQLMARLQRLLLGDDPSADVRVPAAMLASAISGAVMHPLVADVDDETLRKNLLDLAPHFLTLTD
jgi:AcrR family transcriptional regulator